MFSEQLQRAIKGARQSLKLYAAQHSGADVHALQRLLDNLGSVDCPARPSLRRR